MDLVEQMNREYEDAFIHSEKWDGAYSRVRLPRKFFIRVCRALAAVEKITHELHTLALEEPEEEPGTHWGKLEVKLPDHAQEKIGYMIEGAALVSGAHEDEPKKDGGAA